MRPRSYGTVGNLVVAALARTGRRGHGLSSSNGPNGPTQNFQVEVG